MGRKGGKLTLLFYQFVKLQEKFLSKVNNLDKNNHRIEYFNPVSSKDEYSSIFNGEELQWSDWAMRWCTKVDYEMNGKDLIESFILSSKINRIIGGRPPNNFTYELFLDAKGEWFIKIIEMGYR